jgi:hypothetical protein
MEFRAISLISDKNKPCISIRKDIHFKARNIEMAKKKALRKANRKWWLGESYYLDWVELYLEKPFCHFLWQNNIWLVVPRCGLPSLSPPAA